MVFVTGDCHCRFDKFSLENFPEQMEMSRNDIVIVCGDFGIWNNDEVENKRMDWLSRKPFTIVFVDGNHENFDRLYSNEFATVRYKGGKAHKIRDNIYHLMRGYVFRFEGKDFFCMGGAQSQDIKDGIFDTSNYTTADEALAEYDKWCELGKQFRINHFSWWKEELPSDAEMVRGKRVLQNRNYEVDYVISHCLPQSVATAAGYMKPDKLTIYFDDLLANGLVFSRWYCGHYHKERSVFGTYIIKYHDIERIL